MTAGFVFILAAGAFTWWYLTKDNQDQDEAAIQYGSRGALVKILQRRLNQMGASLKVDGIFGNNTMSASKKWLAKTTFKQSDIDQISA